MYEFCACCELPPGVVPERRLWGWGGNHPHTWSLLPHLPSPIPLKYTTISLSEIVICGTQFAPLKIFFAPSLPPSIIFSSAANYLSQTILDTLKSVIITLCMDPSFIWEQILWRVVYMTQSLYCCILLYPNQRQIKVFVGINSFMCTSIYLYQKGWAKQELNLLKC